MSTINYKFADGHVEDIEVSEEFKREYELLLVQEQAQKWKIKKQRQRAELKSGRDVSLERLSEIGYEIKSDEPDPLESLIEQEERRDYYAKLLHQLTDKQRTVYILKLQGLTQSQIANKLGLTISSVNERLQNAQKRISNYFLKNPKI